MWGFFDVGIAAIVVMQMFLSVTRLRHGCFVWQQGPFACICQDSGGSNPRTLWTPFSYELLLDRAEAMRACQTRPSENLSLSARLLLARATPGGPSSL